MAMIEQRKAELQRSIEHLYEVFAAYSTEVGQEAVAMIKYIELKTGFGDDGPAWIARVESSASGKTLYFNNKAFKSWQGLGIGGNYYDVETSETYWISSPKKNGQDRHWAGHGKIRIQAEVVDEYLALIGRDRLDERFEVTSDIQPTDRSRFHALENEQPKKGKRARKRIRTKKGFC